uniref:Glutathione peroxidase 3 n=1 Tax=Erpetoichthys calabaricus TaxID=27687 RepID=A0A8C4T791_ERPCA
PPPLIQASFISFLLTLAPRVGPEALPCEAGVEGTIHSYGAMTLDGSKYVSFKEYAGKTVLFVNVATY